MEQKRFCYKYPHPAVSADCVLFGVTPNELKILLIERGNDPYKGCWAFAGGFMEIDETAEQCAARELLEETGLSNIHLEQFGTFSDVNRDPRERVMTVAFLALVEPEKCTVLAGDDAAKAQWFNIDELPPLAFDHNNVLDRAKAHLKLLLQTAKIGITSNSWNLASADLDRIINAL